MAINSENYDYTNQIRQIVEADHDHSNFLGQLIQFCIELRIKHRNQKLLIRDNHGELIISHRFQAAKTGSETTQDMDKTLLVADPDEMAVREMAKKLFSLGSGITVSSCVIIQELAKSESAKEALADSIAHTLITVDETGDVVDLMYDVELGLVTNQQVIEVVIEQIIETKIEEIAVLLRAIGPEFAYFSSSDFTLQDRLELANAVCTILDNESKKLLNG